MIVERPICLCHGEPMRWAKDSVRKSGGIWRCVVRAKLAAAKYNRKRRTVGGTCGARGCVLPTHQYRSGKFDLMCLEHALVRGRKNNRKRNGSDIPPEAAPLSPYESARRAGLARGDQILDEAIARYEDELKQFTTPHPEVTCLTH